MTMTMAPEKDQNSEWTASNEVDWDKIMTTMTQSWRELTPEQQKAKSQESKPPELTAEEKSKKLTVGASRRDA
ncbi:hypothetical protein Brms1b_003008 [Colletotrichum noveboracense]|nr:hypothetical protein Brms1b_003008 [Colletotrichum noveboracense]